MLTDLVIILIFVAQGFTELRRLIDSSSKTDKTGLLMNGLVCIAFVAGNLIAFIGVAAGLDAFYYLFPILTSDSYPLQKLIFRYAIGYCIAIEATRSFTILFLMPVFILQIVLRILKEFEKLPVNDLTLQLYSQLQVCSQLGHYSVRLGAGVLVPAGFIACVIGLWILLTGWKVMAVGIYLMFAFITIFYVLYYLIHCHS